MTKDFRTMADKKKPRGRSRGKLAIAPGKVKAYEASVRATHAQRGRKLAVDILATIQELQAAGNKLDEAIQCHSSLSQHAHAIRYLAMNLSDQCKGLAMECRLAKPSSNAGPWGSNKNGRYVGTKGTYSPQGQTRKRGSRRAQS